MNRRLATLASGVLLAGSVGLAGPAHAAGTCAGTGTMTFSSGVGFVAVFPSTAVSFEFAIYDSPSCVGGLSAQGWLSAASCGNSEGYGSVNTRDFDNEPIYIATSGSVWMITDGGDAAPDINGVLQETPITGSCAAGTANVFRLTGAVHW